MRDKLIVILILFISNFTAKSQDDSRLIIEKSLTIVLYRDTFSNIDLLTHQYPFKTFENGVGKDYENKIKLDTITITSDRISQDLIPNKIKTQNIAFLTYNDICKRTLLLDSLEIVSQNFLEIYFLKNNLNDKIIAIKNRGMNAQYIGNAKCIDAFLGGDYVEIEFKKTGDIWNEGEIISKFIQEK
ncbi:hypothetical protein [Saccharicrinis sp. FJH54]|uniref:hypothetical protein n=1 Tax=Saccharicrinis sp. FJH54 TaxID=3344665 RepID=UPI0035D469A4